MSLLTARRATHGGGVVAGPAGAGAAGGALDAASQRPAVCLVSRQRERTKIT